MTDERLQRARRRWAANKTPEHEVDLLRERLRTGELAKLSVELAAGLGHQPALETLGANQPPSDPLGELLLCAAPTSGPTDWKYSPETAVRLGLAVVYAAYQLVRPSLPDAIQEEIARRLGAMRGWMNAPEGMTQDAVVSLVDFAADASGAELPQSPLERGNPRDARADFLLAFYSIANEFLIAMSTSPPGFSNGGVDAALAVAHAMSVVNRDSALESARESVVPWLLRVTQRRLPGSAGSNQSEET